MAFDAGKVVFNPHRVGDFRRVEMSGTTLSLTQPYAVVGCTNSAGAKTLTINSALIAQMDEFGFIVVKDEAGDAGTNNLTIATQGSETIDGAATKVISANYGSVMLYGDGTNLFSF